MASPPEQYHYPSAQPPQQQQQRLVQQQQHPQLQYSQPSQQQTTSRAKPRSFSFRSDKSHHSGGSKSDFYETHEEKEARRLHTKADPSLAINEAEPSTVAAMMTQTSHVPLRSMQHKDTWGNPISDPDKSNPTRSRWERPLDTIRSFEAAIDGGYNRKSMYRSDTDSVAAWNKRNSFHPQNQPRFPQDSYYGSRPTSFRAESSYGAMTPGANRNSYYDAQGYGGGYGNGNGNGNGYGRPNPRERAQRMHSEGHYQTYGREQQNIYPMPHKDRSYETVTSAAQSGNSDAAGYQTDPTSSDNSSIDRTSSAKRQEPTNDYGIGFNQAQTYHSPNFSVGLGANSGNSHPLPPAPALQQQQQHGAAPAVPRKQTVLKRQVSRQESPDKQRKSWFSRRFSKTS
ncbi:hypothetical protein VFPFJ_03316 [Purpureocillium lilacinum]|uniref:DUF2406 domain-containing protein n=1 Tax=Purpureocillium lilacinum TaxID=33203 RepID=A0A179GWA0_PURLI|nr:hypothetical protein VFPFJ_03316 [Purpureocillium lilacinum]OAQ81521.1 hypothetical protein VFPBJ_04105 [Purpureocillium lilacinum]OAQ91576.1 hypothetical protein VFPFJ_03316 [Purpureocillium lilacinum]